VLRLIRVILTAQVSGFTSGLRQAEHSLGSFLKAAGMIAGGIAAAFAGLPILLNGLISSIEGLVQRVMTLGKELLAPAMTAERFRTILTHVTGSADQAASMFGTLEQMSMQYGFALEDLIPAGQQMAVMLRGMNGEVDPEAWQRWLNVLLRLHTLRPDVPMQLLARGLSGLVAGDVSTLTRLLDIDVRSLIETLGPEFAGFLNDVQGATETQLGRVTRVGEQAGGAMGDALALAEALSDTLGAGQELLEDYGQTFEGQVGRLSANWEHLKLVFGEPILDVLNDGLERFLDFLEDHQEEIDAFVQKMGELAATQIERGLNWLFEQDWESIINDVKEFGEAAYEFFTSPEMQEAMGNLVDALGSLGEASLEGVRSFFEDVDWNAVADALNVVAGAIRDIATFGQQAGDAFGQLHLSAPANWDPGGQPAAEGDGTAAPEGASPGGYGSEQNPDILAGYPGTSVAPSQEMTVRVVVGVDPETGNLQGYVDDRANQAIEEVVEGTGGTQFNRRKGH
jgi:hypothetical protein